MTAAGTQTLNLKWIK